MDTLFMGRRVPVLYGMVLALMYAGQIHAQVLEPAQHMTDDKYQSDFGTEMIDFNATLPWAERFTPSGAFDPKYSLKTGGMAKLSMQGESGSLDSMASDSMGNGAFDGVGIVKGIRASSGKVKIQHGPLDRLGMPAMTMMFKVADPEMLKGLKEGATISFNLDNTDGGFTVTKIEQGGGQ